MDKELQKIAPKAARGRFYVDKLVKVWRQNGRETWVLIHIELQTQRDRHFSKRLFDYNRRISDRYNRTVVSLAVLADDSPKWRPDRYEEELWDCWVGMRWQPVKLLDYAGRQDFLEASSNPFAQVVLAHLKALETRRDPAARRFWKLQLVRGLYERGWDSEDVRQLFQLIDGLLDLPPRVDRAFRRELDAYEEERRMRYVTSIERVAMLEMMEDVLRIRFGEAGVTLIPAIEELNDAEKYRALNRLIATGAPLEEIRRACAEAAAPSPRRKRGGSSRGGSSDGR